MQKIKIKKMLSVLWIVSIVLCSCSNARADDIWVGKYINIESYSGPYENQNKYWIYEVYAYKLDGNFYANISVDGYMTSEKNLAKAEIDKNNMVIYYVDKMTDVPFSKKYDDNSMLLKLYFSGNNIEAEWGALKIGREEKSGFSNTGFVKDNSLENDVFLDISLSFETAKFECEDYLRSNKIKYDSLNIKTFAT